MSEALEGEVRGHRELGCAGEATGNTGEGAEGMGVERRLR